MCYLLNRGWEMRDSSYGTNHITAHFHWYKMGWQVADRVWHDIQFFSWKAPPPHFFDEIVVSPHCEGSESEHSKGTSYVTSFEKHSRLQEPPMVLQPWCSRCMRTILLRPFWCYHALPEVKKLSIFVLRLSIYIPWPFPPVWGVALYYGKQEK